jgi:DnaJ-class molecular chaperone
MDASTQDIRRAFRAKVPALHPDRFAGASKEVQDEATLAFQELCEAYETLMNRSKRIQYDRAIQIPQGLVDLLRLPAGTRAMARLLSRAPKQARHGDDCVVVVPVPEAILNSGGSVADQDTLPSGLDPLFIPPCAHAMPWAQVEESGEPGENEGERGDLFILLIPKDV